MKKKLLVFAGSLIVCAAVAIGLSISSKANVSALILANVEALAGDEYNPDYEPGKHENTYMECTMWTPDTGFTLGWTLKCYYNTDGELGCKSACQQK